MERAVWNHRHASRRDSGSADIRLTAHGDERPGAGADDIPEDAGAGRGLLVVIASTLEQRARLTEALPAGATALLVSSFAQARQVMAQLPGATHSEPAGEGREMPTPSADEASQRHDPHGSSAAEASAEVSAAASLPPSLRLREDRLSLALGPREVSLTTLEMDVLRYLLARPGEVATFEQLSQVAWHTNYLGNGAHMHAAVGRLRAKLTHLGAPVTLQAVRGQGFRLVRHDWRALQEAVGS